MSNFETLFKRNSVKNIRNYQKSIRDIRQNDKTRNGKINSIVNQVEYMNLMHNIGNKFGGNEPMLNLTVSKDTFDEYTDNDVDYLYKSLSVPYSTSKKSILGHLQNVHNTIKYLNLSNEKYNQSESENTTDSESDNDRNSDNDYDSKYNQSESEKSQL